jgi:hypothetical protein
MSACLNFGLSAFQHFSISAFQFFSMLTYKDNLAHFQKTLKQYVAFSEKDYVDICNNKALDLAIKCILHTPKAEAGAIKSLPLTLNGRSTFGTSVWYGHVVKMMVALGEASQRELIKAKRGVRVSSIESWRHKVSAASKRMIGRRLSAIGFLRSGWLACVGTLLATAGVEPKRRSYGSGKIFGSPKGYVVRAKQGTAKPFTIIANTCASSVKGHGARKVHDLIQEGAARALAASDEDMRQYIEKKIAKTIKYFTGR